MSDTDRTITRRRAIGTSTLFLGAGLLAVAGTPTAPAVADEPLTATVSLARLFPGVDPAWLAEWKELHDAASHDVNAAYEAIEAQLGQAGRALLMDLEASINWRNTVDDDLLVEQIATHVPGVGPAIRLVYEHLLSGSSPDSVLRCCDHV